MPEFSSLSNPLNVLNGLSVGNISNAGNAIVSALAGAFASESRLYALSLPNPPEESGILDGSLLVEGFSAREELHGTGMRDIVLLSVSAHLELKHLLGQVASLQISLSDGTRASFSGLVNQAAMLGSDGGLARYRIRLVPWIWLLSQSHTSRVWQDKSVVEIIESVFSRYAAHAAWTWSDDVTAFMADARPRSYVVQYRESDYDFVRRILTEEGLSWRVEENADAPSSHQLVLFADSTQAGATPEDATSKHALGGSGIRFHGARSREEQDSIQALGARRVLNVAITTVLSMDYKGKQAVSASVPTHHVYGGKNAPVLESYDAPGLYAWADAGEAQRYARLHQEAHEARNKTWLARSTVRTLRPGTRFTLTQGPLESVGQEDPEYMVLEVASAGINNLPRPAQEGLAELFGPLPQLLQSCLASISATGKASTSLAQDLSDAAGEGQVGKQMGQVIAQASSLGYANHFTAIRSDVPWRPVLAEEGDTAGNGMLQNAAPTARGSQSAIVVGADGSAEARGADEIYCDRLGRVRIRFHWQGQQDDRNATCWVRVAQRSAGGGMGSQFLPRIGQEVLVQFVEGDIDRPIIVGALYNGQGEGGALPTPGGKSDSQANLNVFEGALDHQASAQGNLAGGNSPVWHGASAGSAGHANSSAQWGLRSKEFGGGGYNQINFDDTDKQGRIQLKSTQAATELNLGHLIHTADNYRGSFRGQGTELRTDAYGALRAGAGLLLTSYAVQHSASQRDSAGDNVAGMALLKQAATLANSFSDAAKTHQTVEYASHIGSTKPGASVIAAEDNKAPPLKALHTAASGMLSQENPQQAQSDASARSTAPSDGKLPHSTDPIIAISARAGLGMNAGQNLQYSNGETGVFMSGLDTQLVTGNQFRLHTGQAIGMLAGAVKAREGQTGMQLIAAKDAIDIQAQADAISIQARDEVDIMSSHEHIDWAAAKSISLSTSGGANITIEGGNITVQCPGKITIQAGKKSFTGPATIGTQMPVLPRGTMKFDEKFQLLDAGGDPVSNMRYVIMKDGGGKIEGVTDGQGMIPLQQGFSPENMQIKVLGKVT
ncbi:type VI secretion system Vgr family protein [Undibacterium sp. TJN25]|uniref:type VI secretion system Vgr family protein n=1 Tax=Undibacterium sp. TJN25 TaxID=3413056 RepID=UPI003BF3624D